MEQQIIKNDKLGDQYYAYRHETGLEILLYPMKGYSSSYALFGAKIGSIDTAFKTEEDTDYTVVPEGVAHFLEHKLFESEDGDAFSLFAKTGASANAFTSFERTCYLFSTTDNFEESLKSLLKFVQEPYFTQANVEKEQGIIGQEIRMYEDDPDWRVLFNLLGALYHNNPVRIDIAGTADSIAKIDADLLYKCYHTFYNLNNMVLAVAGNFDVDSAVSIIEKGLKPGKKVTVTSRIPEEPEEIKTRRTEQKLSVSTPLFTIGYKEAVRSGYDLLKAQLAAQIIMDVVAGETSSLYRNMYDSGLINQTFGYEAFAGRGYFANLFEGESRDPDQVFALLDQELSAYRKKGISQEEFIRCKKSMYGRLVRAFNNVEAVANGLVNSYFSGVGLYDNMKVVEEITLEEINQYLQTMFQTEKGALSVVSPVE
ncbi:MAG: EF-P 5-aminopentanol modification-associated protein YfmH [Massiliimalia sp.]|jgi:predicted Zn-dependent peptidase